MTRFARAKGSKASNERVPEEATSWAEMKQQLLIDTQKQQLKTHRDEVVKQRNENYKAFLEERENEKMRNTQWAVFPNNKIVTESDDEPPEETSIKMKPQVPLTKVKKVKKTPLKISTKSISEHMTKKRKLLEEDTPNVPKKIKIEDTEAVNKNTEIAANSELSELDKKKIEKKKQRRKKQLEKKLRIKAEQTEKNKQLPQIATKEKLSGSDLEKIENKNQKKIKQLMKKKYFKELEKQEQAKLEEAHGTEVGKDRGKGADVSVNSKTKSNRPVNQIVRPKQQQKSVKTQDKLKNKDRIRKKQKQDKWVINGKEILIEYFDGFPIKKEDADRLKKLRMEMIGKGLPRSEINIAMKLERRKAEKAFAREKKKVCFHCRKSGHNLSECPELDKNQIASAGTGICFKCGSTEHTHFECKVVRGENFKYAHCFICNEQGHIAKQCPDNARGLYPKGGACKVCGDVTHLKKDCPKYRAQQEQLSESVNLTVLDGGNPDDLDNVENKALSVKKRPNKIVKFT